MMMTNQTPKVITVGQARPGSAAGKRQPAIGQPLRSVLGCSVADLCTAVLWHCYAAALWHCFAAALCHCFTAALLCCGAAAL